MVLQFHHAIDNLVLRFASMVAWFDRHIVNYTGINGPGDSLRYASFWTKFHVTGRIPDYALLMIVGIASAGALGFLLR